MARVQITPAPIIAPQIERAPSSPSSQSDVTSPVQAMTVFEERATIYSLQNNSWVKLGVGNLSLLFNFYNPNELVVRLVDPETAQVLQIFQIKPKLKSKGPTSWVLKGRNTRQNNEEVLAIRFVNDTTAQEFKNQLQHRRKTRVTVGPADEDDVLFKLLPQTNWRCALCTFENEPAAKRCLVCSTPRPQMIEVGESEASEIPSETLGDDIPLSPRTSLSSAPGQNAVVPSFGGGGGNNSRPPQSTAAMDEMGEGELGERVSERLIQTGVAVEEAEAAQRDGAAGRGSEPKLVHAHSVAEGVRDSYLPLEPLGPGDVSSTEPDFREIGERIVTAHPKVQAKLFSTLKKVSLNLYSNDPRYRQLDVNNRTLRERLLKYEHVADWLHLLGFSEADSNGKMVCPSGQPPQSVIRASVDVCEEYASIRRIVSDIKRYSTTQHDPSTMSAIESLRSDLRNRSAAAAVPPAERTPPQRAQAAVAPAEEKEAAPAKEEEVDLLTLQDITWWITHETYRNTEARDVLLLCHRAFATSMDLLEVMQKRFHCRVENDDGVADMEATWNIQVKVAIMLRYWMKSYWEEDFESQVEVAELAFGLIDEMRQAASSNTKIGALVDALQQTVENEQREVDKKIRARSRKEPRRNKIANLMGVPSQFNIVDQDEQSVAEQITLMDFRIFKLIEKRECVGQAWKKSSRHELAPNILDMIDQFNRVSKWVQVLILTAPNLRERSRVMKKCIKIAMQLKNLQNFSSLCAFHSALSSTPIYRLKHAWKGVPGRYGQSFEDIKAIFSSDGGFRNLRDLHSQAVAPAIPHIGIFLQDLVAIEEGNLSRRDGKINFSKFMQITRKIDDIHIFRQRGYELRENQYVQKVLADDFKAQERLDQDHIYQFSTDVKNQDAPQRNTNPQN